MGNSCTRPFRCLRDRRKNYKITFQSYEDVCFPPSFSMATNPDSSTLVKDVDQTERCSQLDESFNKDVRLTENQDLLDIEGDAVINKYVGWTALITACYFGDVALLRRLLESGEDVNSADEAGWSPLFIALNKKHYDCVEFLLTKGADATHSNRKGWSALMMAAYALTFNGRNYISSDMRERRSLDTKMLELLLQHVADPNHCSSIGLTALMISVKRGRFDGVQLLIRHKANTRHQAEGGINALILATLFADRSTIQMLLKNGASVNTVTTCGETPLLFAVENREYEIVKLLLDKRAQIYSMQNKFLNPIITAVKLGRSNIIGLLLDRECSEDAKEEVLCNALFVAAKNGHFDIVDVFLRLGVVKINCIKNIIGCTPLMVASENGHLRTVKLLLRYGANVHAVNNKGVSAVGKAVENGDEVIVKTLMKYTLEIIQDTGRQTQNVNANICHDVEHSFYYNTDVHMGSSYLIVNNPSNDDTYSMRSESETLLKKSNYSKDYTITLDSGEGVIDSVSRNSLGKPVSVLQINAEISDA